MKRIVILISGRGSNMSRIVQACADEHWPAQVAAVIADRPEAQGLEFARQRGVATQVVHYQAQPSRDAFDAELMRAVDAQQPDLVVLAGFMRILGAPVVRRYEGRMLNVHPSLLPAFAGLHTHQRAIDAGCKVAGATVHFVTPELDHGPIVAQAIVPVRADDNANSLALRVIEREHEMYPRAVRWFVEGRLAIHGLQVRQLDGASQLF
jgi:phosphoribosylglycinamide formyltransferase 1